MPSSMARFDVPGKQLEKSAAVQNPAPPSNESCHSGRADSEKAGMAAHCLLPPFASRFPQVEGRLAKGKSDEAGGHETAGFPTGDDSRSNYDRCFLKKATVRSHASLAAASS